MKRPFVRSILFLLFTTSLHAAWPGEPSLVQLKGTETPAQIQAAYSEASATLLPTLGYGKDSAKALAHYEAIVHHAARPGAEPERLGLCQAVATALQGEVSAEAKAWLLKLIAFVGCGELVPAEASLLDDREPLVRESARYALQLNPAPDAAVALRTALRKATTPAWQGALALALGARKDIASVPTLAKLLSQPDEAAVEAALYALGNIADAEATKAIAGAQKSVPQNLRVAAAEAYAKCAEQMLRNAQTAAAAEIYRALFKASSARSVRLAAAHGLILCAGEDAPESILQMLTGEDADVRSVAANAIPDLSGAGLKKLAAGMGKLPPATQVMVLAALSDRGEKTARPEALTAAQSPDESIRLAGLSALGRLGDASTVPVLVAASAAGGNGAGPARDSLTQLDGAGVNEAIVAAMQKESDANRRGELIGLLENRGAAVAVPALLQQTAIATGSRGFSWIEVQLLKQTANDDKNVHRAAMRALGKLATPKDLPPMLATLLKSSPGGDRDEAERAIASVCARISNPDQQAEPVLTAYREAGAEQKAILIPVLGRLGGSKSFEVVKAALASADPATSKAGETALANWPDADETVEAELLTLAQRGTAKPADRASALRAYLRVISLPSGLPDQTRLKKFQKAMELAERDPERNTILEKVAELRRIETLRFVSPYLDQPTLCSRAGNTICELAKEGSLRTRNAAEFESALNKIISVCKDQGVVDRAKRRLAGQ